jgi:uncharacterized protein
VTSAAWLPEGSAFLAGVMNAVAGGGTFLSFPALIAAGVSPIPANATSAAAVWVGNLGGARGYASELREQRALLGPVLATSLAGGLVGAILLIHTPSHVFARMIPWLLLFATAVYALSPLLVKRQGAQPRLAAWQLSAQFLVAIYGGYFGAGMGILMLAILSFTGFPTFNTANAVKNLLSVAINGIALVPFLIVRLIDWRFALPMAAMALVGGYGGVRLVRRIPSLYARIVVIAIGIGMTVVFFRR